MARSRWTPARRRASGWAFLAAALGLGMYYFDDWCESLQSPVLHGVLDAFELAVMGPGLALLAYLTALALARRDERLRSTVLEERERRFAFLGRIAASVAHEIRNPLHNAHLLHEELAARLDSVDVDLSSRLRQNLRRVDHATTLIYELARQPARGAEADATDLDSELQQAVTDVRGELGPGTDIRIDGETGATIRCRASSTFIILRNVIRNAAQAGASAAIHVTIDRAADDIRIRVRNRGRLNPALLEEPTTDEPASSGLGVGLSLTRHLLALANGSLSFTADGETVVAQIRLPAAQSAPVATGPAPASSPK